MKLKANKDAFLKGIGIVSGVVNPRATLPILSNLLIETVGNEQVRITGTDLEIGMVCNIPMEIKDEGSITLPAKKLHDIVKELSQGTFEFHAAKNNSVTIKNDSSLFKVVGLPKDDFPKLPNPDSSSGVELEQKDFKECLNLTTFAISHDETRYVLNGVLLEIKGGTLKIVATDGRRLAVIEKPVSVPKSFSQSAIIPAKTLHELQRILTDQGTFKLIPLENQILFHFGDVWLVTRLIEGNFPNYDQVIPKEENTTAELDREKFLAAIRRASLLTSPEAQAVKFDVVDGKVIVSSRSPNLGEAREEVEANAEGDDLVIGFNPSYFLDVLKNLDIDNLLLSFSSPDRPTIIKGKEGYLCVIMPMQLN